MIDRYGGEDSEGHLLKVCDYPEAAVMEAIRWLVDSEWVTASRKGNSVMYAVTTKGSRDWKK